MDGINDDILLDESALLSKTDVLDNWALDNTTMRQRNRFTLLETSNAGWTVKQPSRPKEGLSATTPRQRFINDPPTHSRFLGTRSMNHRFPVGSTTLLKDVEPMSGATRYLLTYYLAFDEFSGTEGEEVLKKVLGEFLERGSTPLRDPESETGNDSERARGSHLAKTIWEAVHEHCESSFELNRWTKTERNLRPFPNELCAAVCCDALCKVSKLFAAKCGIGRLMEVIKTGIFSCVYKDYDPSKWFFELSPYFNSIESLKRKNTIIKRKLTDVLGAEQLLDPVERALEAASGLGAKEWRAFGTRLFGERPDVSLLSEVFASMNPKQQRFFFSHIVEPPPTPITTIEANDGQQEDAAAPEETTGGEGEATVDEVTGLGQEERVWLTGMLVEHGGHRSDEMLESICDALADKADALALVGKIRKRFPDLSIFGDSTATASLKHQLTHNALQGRLARIARTQSSTSSSIVDPATNEGTADREQYDGKPGPEQPSTRAEEEEQIQHGDEPLDVANHGMLGWAASSPSHVKGGIVQFRSREHIQGPAQKKKNPAKVEEGKREEAGEDTPNGGNDEGNGGDNAGGNSSDEESRSRKVQILGMEWVPSVGFAGSWRPSTIVVRVVSLIGYPRQTEQFAIRVHERTTVPQLRSLIMAISEQGRFVEGSQGGKSLKYVGGLSLIDTETGYELGLMAQTQATHRYDEEPSHLHHHHGTRKQSLVAMAADVSLLDLGYSARETKPLFSEDERVLPILVCRSLKHPDGIRFSPQDNLAGAVVLCTEHRAAMLTLLNSGFTEEFTSALQLANKAGEDTLAGGSSRAAKTVEMNEGEDKREGGGEVAGDPAAEAAYATAAMQAAALEKLPPLLAEQAVANRDLLLSLLLSSDQCTALGLSSQQHSQLVMKQKHHKLGLAPTTDALDGGRPTAEQLAAVEQSKRRAVELLEEIDAEIEKANRSDVLAEKERASTLAQIEALDTAALALRELEAAIAAWECDFLDDALHAAKLEAEKKAETALWAAEALGKSWLANAAYGRDEM